MKPGMKLSMLLVTAILFWGGLFYFASCASSPEKRAVEMAEKALKATVDNPESIKILGVSKADSVFGKEYVSPHEKVSLSMHLMQYGQKLMEETDFFENLDKDDIGISEQMKRQLDAMTTLRALIASGDMNPTAKEGKSEKPFNGWKVKIDFEAKTLQGEPYHSEYWFILDKEAQCVVKSFEIPLQQD